MIVQQMQEYLEMELALKTYLDIKKLDGNWWRTAVHSGDLQYYDRTLEHRYLLEGRDKEITDSLRSNKFTYKFSRTTPHVPTCNCVACVARHEIIEKRIRQTVIEYTSLKNPKLYSYFLSAYEPGDFLSTHTDINRDVAFMLYLTPNWLPEYGGLLNVYTSGGAFETYVPKFNTLALMDLKDGKGRHHFVSEVSQRAPEPRIAITGWFNEDS